MNILYLVSSLTFGRDSARYWELLAIMAVVSVVLWVFVIITTLLRFALRLRYRHSAMAGDETNTHISSGS